MFFRILFILLAIFSIKTFAEDKSTQHKQNSQNQSFKKIELSHKQLENIKASIKAYSSKKEISTVEL